MAYAVEIVIEVDIPRTQVAPQECGVCCEDRRHVYVFRTTGHQPETSEPLVKVSHDRRRWILWQVFPELRKQTENCTNRSCLQ